jgi:hypothetical protein
MIAMIGYAVLGVIVLVLALLGFKSKDPHERFAAEHEAAWRARH